MLDDFMVRAALAGLGVAIAAAPLDASSPWPSRSWVRS